MAGASATSGSATSAWPRTDKCAFIFIKSAVEHARESTAFPGKVLFRPEKTVFFDHGFETFTFD
jgi:hypothetical protein